jgi:hypothetical protein
VASWTLKGVLVHIDSPVGVGSSPHLYSNTVADQGLAGERYEARPSVTVGHPGC